MTTYRTPDSLAFLLDGRFALLLREPGGWRVQLWRGAVCEVDAVLSRQNDEKPRGLMGARGEML